MTRYVVMQEGAPEVVHRIEITGGLDRRAAEALYLELRRLTKRYGAEIKECKIERIVDETTRSREREEAKG